MLKHFAFSLVLFVCFSANATYLQWQVAPGYDNNGLTVENGKYYIEGREITKARVMMSSDGGESYSGLDNGFGGESIGEYALASWTDDWGEKQSDFASDDASNGLYAQFDDVIDDPSKYLFYIELVGYDTRWSSQDDVVLGVSETSTYADLLTAGWIDPTTMLPSHTAWTGGTYVVPEPTSALLLILGFGALGLKRRNERV